MGKRVLKAVNIIREAMKYLHVIKRLVQNYHVSVENVNGQIYRKEIFNYAFAMICHVLYSYSCEEKEYEMMYAC